MYIYHFANYCSNPRMEITIADIRKINYEKLRKASGLGKGAFAVKMETDPAYISQIFSEKTARDMGSDLARKIESLAGKTRGWMDVLHKEEGEDVHNNRTETKLELSEQTDLSPLISVASPRTQAILETLNKADREGRLTEDDLKLIDAIAQRLVNDKNRKNR